MPRQFSPRDIELLGYRDTKVTQENSAWTRVVGIADGGIQKIQTEFLYLKADCTSEQAHSAAQDTTGTSKPFVLLTASHKLSLQTVKSIFSGRVSDVAEIEDVVWQKLSSVFAKYLEELQRTVPGEQYFVKPRKERESHAQLDKELVSYLSGRGDIRPGTLAVVSAAAGVGKTTVARQATLALVRQVNTTKVIPVFVEASHWSKFNLESNVDLWDIIRNSIDKFGGNVGLSEELFNYGLQQGYFVFIFDGFDELCSPKHSQFSPIDVLRILSDLSKQTDARILITTRTLFWKNEIERVGTPTNVSVLTLAPFNKDQANGYFEDRFKTNRKKLDQAKTLYRNLVSHSDLPENENGGARAKFANLPLVVVMLAQLVDKGGVDFESHGLLIEDLLVRLCIRDQGRQDLVANAKEQLMAFEELAVSWDEPVNPEFDLETLELVGFPTEDLKDLRHHALISPGKTSNTYSFRWDFLAPYMRALFLKRFIQMEKRTASDIKKAQKIMQSDANGKGFVFEHLLGLLQSADLEVVAKLYRQTAPTDAGVRSFLVHLLLALIADDKGSFTTLSDRTAEFIRCVTAVDSKNNERLIEDLSIVGNLEKLDFKGLRFTRCSFRDASFVNCQADQNTVFDECHFSGTLDLNPVEVWGDVQVLQNCTVRNPAALTWNSVLKESEFDPEESLLDAFKLGLGKFWHNGSPKDNLKRDDWKRGLLGRTKYCQPILNALIKAGVIIESAKGQYDEPKLLFSKDCFGDLQRFMDNRQLTGRIDEAFQSVKF